MKMKPRIISSVKGSLLYCFLEIYIDAEYPVISLFVCFFLVSFFLRKLRDKNKHLEWRNDAVAE